MKILLAPDKFKGILSSAEIAAALRKLIHEQDPSLETIVCPMADGGDGTLECVLSGMNGRKVRATAHDPLMRPREADYGIARCDGRDSAIIEMAQASGLSLLAGPERDPMRTTSFGTGELLLDACRQGVTNASITLGGSATVDGGLGFLQALGADLHSSQNIPPGAAGKDLLRIEGIDLGPAKERVKDIALMGLTDVQVPLLGPQGAARLFGPQKGATPQKVEELERALAHFESILSKAAGIPLRDRPGTGAAGGMGMAILALGGELQGGFDFVAKVLGLGKKMEGCDLVITSEGRLDASSLEGKTPVAVARMAKSLGIPCVAVVGAADPRLDRLAEVGISRVYPLFDRPIAMDDPRKAQIPERLAQAIRSLLKENITR